LGRVPQPVGDSSPQPGARLLCLRSSSSPFGMVAGGGLSIYSESPLPSGIPPTAPSWRRRSHSTEKSGSGRRSSPGNGVTDEGCCGSRANNVSRSGGPPPRRRSRSPTLRAATSPGRRLPRPAAIIPSAAVTNSPSLSAAYIREQAHLGHESETGVPRCRPGHELDGRHNSWYDSCYHGAMSEWLKEHVWKACGGQLLLGSNPSRSVVFAPSSKQGPDAPPN